MIELEDDQRVEFRNDLRSARHAMQCDAENFDAVILVVEKLGQCLLEKPRRVDSQGMSAYREPLRRVVQSGGGDVERFLAVFGYVSEGRNQAVHAGAVARHLTTHCHELAVLLEDVLLKKQRAVSDFMVGSVVWAAGWHLMSQIRQLMLANSFSFLPLKTADGCRWLSDLEISRYVRQSDGKLSRDWLADSVEDAMKTGRLSAPEAASVDETDSVSTVMSRLNGSPLLVRRTGTEEVVGIITAYDLL